MEYTFVAKILAIFAIVATSGFSSPISTLDADLHKGNLVVCYYGSWSVYRPGAGKFEVEDIDPTLCTHAIFAFAGLEYDGTLKILDPWNELEENWGRGAMRRFTNMKRVNPKLKTLLAIGGWNEGSEKYSDMAKTQESRKRFIDSVIPFLHQYNFDGFDLDWEYPAARGGIPIDKVNFALLCQEMRAEFDKHDLLLTAAVSAGEYTITPAYDIPSIANSLHFINVMTYDLHGAWENHTGHNSPLYPMPSETGNQTKLNMEYAINFWINGGCPPHKLILGMGTYGRGFLLDDPNQNGFYAPAQQAIPAGPYTREAGIWGYNEILEKFAQGGWTIVRDSHVTGPYAYKNREWIGYDDVASITLKANWARSMKLGGGMFWSVETDDFRGSHSPEKYPLIKTLVRALNDGVLPPPPPTTTEDVRYGVS